MQVEIEIKSNSEKYKKFARSVIVEWPESEKIMCHKDALLLTGKGENEVLCYLIPLNVWESYKN